MLEKIEMKIGMFFTSIMQTKEEKRAYNKARYWAKKDMLRAQHDAWRERQGEELRAKDIARLRAYRKTPEGKKQTTIDNWKKYNLKCDDVHALYEKYLNTTHCEECSVELAEGLVSNGRCMDHDHTTGLFRNVLCRACNVRRG
jgi:hypothetical protein